MAAIAWIANASTGNWSTGANWSGGSAPAIGDEVGIGTNGNSGTSITVSAASSGATSITVSGTSVSLKRGAIIAIAGTVGLYALRSDRSGNGAVSIDPPLRAAVSASSALTYYNGGAECVVDTDAVCGGDSRYGLLVSTVLKASRSVSTTLTCRGSISVIQQTCRLDYGSPADPIPSGVTAGILFDLGASPTANKYGLLMGRSGNNDPASPTTTSDCGGAFMWGATKTPHSDMAVGITAGGSTFTVPDATGWAVGDRVAVPPSANYTNQETRAISGITGAGPYEVTVSSPWTYAHAAGLPAMNLTRNVYVSVIAAGQPACVHVHAASTATADSYRFGYVEFATGGGQTVVGGMAWISTTVWTAANVPWRDIVGCSFHHRMRDGTNIATHQGVGPAGNAVTAWPLVWDNCVMFEEARLGNNIALVAGALYYMTDCVSVGGSYGLFSGYSQGGQGSIFTRLRMYGAGTVFAPNPCINLAFIDCTIDNHNYTFLPQTGAFTFQGGAIGQTYAGAATMCQFGAANQSITATFTDTLFPPSGNLIGDSDFVRLSASFRFLMVNKDADATKQEEWTRPGVVVRDNATINRSRSSVKLTLKSSTVPKVWSVPFAASSGIAVRVIGYVQHDATYGSANPVSVSLSGAGSTPATFTAATSASAWQKFDLTVTPTANGTITLAVTALSDSVNGNVWIDGVSHAPWIDWSWHYGMAYTPAVPYATVDPVITQTTEATVAAYAGLSFGSNTLTISTAHTMAEVYDWLSWYAASNRIAPIISSTDGQTYDLTCNVTVTAALTGGTRINLPAHAMTISGGGSVAAIYQDSSGTSARLQITLPLSPMYVCLHDGSGADVECDVQSGVYSRFIPPGATGTWTWAINKQGYVFALGTFTPGDGGLFAVSPSCPQVMTSAGDPMYQGTTSALVQVTFSGGYAYIDIGNGTPSLQAIFDACEDALYTDAGLDWIIAGNDSTAIFNSFGGDYLFLTDGWRIRRWHAGDSLATVPAFVQSTEGIPIDESNGPVAYLTSDNPTAIASAVWAHLSGALVASGVPAIRNLVEADEVHTPTAIQKRQRGTSTVLLEKAWSGHPLKDFAAVQP